LDDLGLVSWPSAAAASPRLIKVRPIANSASTSVPVAASPALPACDVGVDCVGGEVGLGEGDGGGGGEGEPGPTEKVTVVPPLWSA
jgi:hypothetical protein